MKPKQFSSKYLKTLHYENLEGNNNFLTVLSSNESFKQYASDLIVDLYNRRGQNNKKFIIISEFFWLNEIIEKALKEEIKRRNVNLELIEKLIFTNFKSSNEYFDKYFNNYFDVIIAINFTEISKYDECFFKELKNNNTDSVLIGINISNEFIDEQDLSLDEIEINHVQDEPNSFTNFANDDILNHIKDFVRNFHNRQEIIQLHDIIFYQLSEANIYTEYIVSFGTSEYIDAEGEEDDDDAEGEEEEEIVNYNNIKDFLLKISVSRYELHFYIELQDYDWDGTLYFEYNFNFEDEITEDIKGKMLYLEDYMKEVWERYSKNPNLINFAFEGF